MRTPIPALLLSLLALPAVAADGVLEINQTCAVQTGCFQGDAAGFPVTIGTAGSYQLTGNLTVPANTTAVQIDSTNVTLDLGGFTVAGPNLCTGYPVTSCTSVNGNAGIQSDQFFVVARNGNVSGMAGPCIALRGASSRVEDVRVLACGHTGIFVGPFATVTGSVSAGNHADGIYAKTGSLLERNEIHGTGAWGIVFESSNPHLGGALISNRVFQNANGIIGDAGVLLRGNVSRANSGYQISFNGGVSTGDNLCDGVAC